DGPHAARRLDLDFFSLAPSEQRRAHRAFVRDLPAAGIGLSRADNTVRFLWLAFRLDRHLAADFDPLGRLALIVALVDDRRVTQQVFQILDPAFEEGLLLLRV